MTDEPKVPDTLTPKELAAMAGVTINTVIVWCRSGRIPARRVGGRWRIKVNVLKERDPDLWEEYLESLRRDSESFDLSKAPKASESSRGAVTNAGALARATCPVLLGKVRRLPSS